MNDLYTTRCVTVHIVLMECGNFSRFELILTKYIYYITSCFNCRPKCFYYCAKNVIERVTFNKIND